MTLKFFEIQPGTWTRSLWAKETQTQQQETVTYRRFYACTNLGLLDSKNRQVGYEFTINVWPDGKHTISPHVLRNGKWYGAIPTRQKNMEFKSWDEALRRCEEILASRLNEYLKRKDFIVDPATVLATPEIGQLLLRKDKK